MRPTLDRELNIGGKKCYAIDKGATIEVLVDCNMCSGVAHLVIPMTPERFVEWQMRHAGGKGRLIQEIFPDMKSEIREVLVTGITPAEWKDTFGEKEYTVPQLQALGYKFDEDFLAANTNTDEKNQTS